MNPNEHSRIPLLVVLFLGIIGILLCAGVLVLTYYDKKIDGGLFTLAGGAVGALGALLTNTERKGQRGTDAPVTVETEPGKPLETTAATIPATTPAPDVADEPQADDEPQPPAAPRGALSKTVLKL